MSARRIHGRLNGHDIVVGTVAKVTGDQRAAWSYQPVEDLPETIYGWQCSASGDAGWCESWTDARRWVIDCARVVSWLRPLTVGHY